MKYEDFPNLRIDQIVRVNAGYSFEAPIVSIDMYNIRVGVYHNSAHTEYPIKCIEILNEDTLSEQTKSGCQCGIPEPDADKECCRRCGLLIYPE